VSEEADLDDLRRMVCGDDQEAISSVRMPVAGLVYLRYLGEDGTSWMRFRFIGNQPLSLTLGDMQQIGHSFMHEDGLPEEE
jgi:hypothetical protein